MIDREVGDLEKLQKMLVHPEVPQDTKKEVRYWIEVSKKKIENLEKRKLL